MQKYSKAIGAFLGSIVGLALSFGLIDQSQHEALAAMIPTLMATLGAFFAPKNSD